MSTILQPACGWRWAASIRAPAPGGSREPRVYCTSAARRLVQPSRSRTRRKRPGKSVSQENECRSDMSVQVGAEAVHSPIHLFVPDNLHRTLKCRERVRRREAGSEPRAVARRIFYLHAADHRARQSSDQRLSFGMRLGKETLFVGNEHS